jgi:hypothetical protein
MPAFKAIFAGAAIGTLVLVAVNQRALWPLEVAALEQPPEAPAPKSDRLDGLVKLREAMMRAASRPQPEAAAEPKLQQAALGSMPGTASDPSLIAAPKVGEDSVETKSVALVPPRCRPTGARNARYVRRCLEPDASNAGFPVSHLLRLVRTTACRETCRSRSAFAQGHSGRNAG